MKFIKKAFFDYNKNILISKLPARFLLNDFNKIENEIMKGSARFLD